ncbi:MAG: STAS domain-containing protein [Methylovulum sp.]|nr:STAS domain-containing protein [Methylovulum sp.]
MAAIMENVTFIDSSTCAILISAFKAMQLKKTGRLVLADSPVVQSLIELTRLHTVFEILPNQKSGIIGIDGRVKFAITIIGPVN